MIMTQQNFNDNNMKMRNSFTAPTQIINNTSPQLIQNQFNFYQWGIVPIYNPNFVQPPAFSPAIQTNNNNINNMDNISNNINANNINNMNNMGSMNGRNSMNNKQIRGKKFSNHQGNFILKSQFMNNYKENHNNLDNDLRGSGLKNKNRLNNENLINDNNKNQINEQIMNMNIQPQLYYFQNQMISNHNYNIMLNNLNNLNQFKNDNVGINK
jgi:hypothetical protein